MGFCRCCYLKCDTSKWERRTHKQTRITQRMRCSRVAQALLTRSSPTRWSSWPALQVSWGKLCSRNCCARVLAWTRSTSWSVRRGTKRPKNVARNCWKIPYVLVKFPRAKFSHLKSSDSSLAQRERERESEYTHLLKLIYS